MTGMKVIKPTVITDAMFTSSTVAEPDATVGEVAWSAATSYATGAVVIRTSTHMKYERIGGSGVHATPPESAPLLWLAVGPTNRWAMFDRKIGTLTSAATTFTTVMRPGAISGLGVLEAAGRTSVITYKDAPGGTVVYLKTVDLDGSLITSFYEWFFAEFEQLTDFVLTDLPEHYTSGELTVQMNGTTGVSAGVLQVGRVLDVGKTLIGSTVDIIDYSRKNVDPIDGTVDVLERTFSKRISLQVLTEASNFNKIFRSLAALRATPCIYIGTGNAGFEPLIGYGFYKSFSMVVAYSKNHLCNLEIEGLSQ